MGVTVPVGSARGLMSWCGVIALLACGTAGALTPEELAVKAEAVLRAHCYRCHGQKGSDEGGFNYVLDPVKLIAEQKIVPGQAAKSTLIERISEGEMPPEGESPRPNTEEMAALKEWVDAGAPAFGTPAPNRSFISNDAVVREIQKDLAKRNPLDRQFQRYFTLVHLYNAGISDDGLQTYRHALSKLVNSLSWGHEVVRPEKVDSAELILRIDLRDFDWARREVNVWDDILDAYPYGVSYESPEAREVYEQTRTQLPYVMADWFVAIASRPPLYHKVLQLPGTSRELEALLRIDAANDIEQARVARAGFNESGVSQSNRIIERHPSVYGAYWKSYDFRKSTEERSIFEHPLGPRDTKVSNGFVHDGAEIIFSLPNGLQAYMIVGGDGRRLDRAPPEIVTDRTSRDTMVENGRSCMACHLRGLNEKRDQIREAVEGSRSSFGDEADRILALYPEPSRFSALVQKDNLRFRTALEQTGAPLGQTEPILELSREFERSLDLRRAAAEFGLRPEELQQRLEAASSTLGRQFSLLRTPGGSIKREAFLKAFPEAVEEWKLGKFMKGSQRRTTSYRLWSE